MCLICSKIKTENLKHIDLYNCLLLSNLDNVICFDLIRLSLHNTPNIKSLPNMNNSLSRIKILSLTDVPQLRRLPPCFTYLEDLKIINSNISSLPKSYTKLKKLYLQDTNIQEIPKTFINLEYLELNTTPVNELYHYPKLYHLLLFRTNITTIPKAYKNNLEELNISLSRNHFDEPCIAVLPPYLTNLKKLYASLSIIEEVPETYINLEVLILHQSYVKYLSPKLVNLEYLDCSETNVKHIPKEYVKLIELTYSHETTTWDSSWYKDDEEIEKVIKIQKWIKTKNYIKDLKEDYGNILYNYLNFIKTKKIKIIQSWMRSCFIFKKYLKKFQINKNKILMEYKQYNSTRIQSIKKLQKFFKTYITYMKVINNINADKTNILTEYKIKQQQLINNSNIIKNGIL